MNPQRVGVAERNLHLDQRFFKNEAEREETLNRITAVTHALEDDNIDEATSRTIGLLQTLWRHFSVEKYTSVFLEFAKIQQALYGLELTEEGGRYRDHLIHVFNVFHSGLLLFSRMIEVDESATWRLLKIRPESSETPFSSAYNQSRRLYYLWSLSSTLHDVAIPIDHKDEIIEGLNRYFGYFEIKAEDVPFRIPIMSTSRAGRYFGLMARVFDQGVVLNPRGGATYKLSSEPSLPLLSSLNMLFEEMNHGVMASYFLYRSLEEIFLKGPNESPAYDLDLKAVEIGGKWQRLPKDQGAREAFAKGDSGRISVTRRLYDEDLTETKKYAEYVYEQDVTRAALAIALHSINPRKHPKIFPIQFDRLPISWILILLDECQEYYRVEGLDLPGVIRFLGFPGISVSRIRRHGRDTFGIDLHFDFEEPRGKSVKKMIDKYNAWRSRERGQEVRTFPQLVRATWEGNFNAIRSKLSFGGSAPVVRIEIEVDHKPLPGSPLIFDSRNEEE